MTSELALSIGLFAGYFALVLYMLWPTNHVCHDPHCTRDQLKK